MNEIDRLADALLLDGPRVDTDVRGRLRQLAAELLADGFTLREAENLFVAEMCCAAIRMAGTACAAAVKLDTHRNTITNILKDDRSAHRSRASRIPRKRTA